MYDWFVKKIDRFLDAHLQHLRDIAILDANVQNLFVESRPLARRADGLDVRHELQLCRDDTFALTMLAASAVFLVEAEVVLGKLFSRFTCRRCIQLTDLIEKANICRRVGACAAANRRLVNRHDTGQMLMPDQRIMLARNDTRIMEQRIELFAHDLVDERAFA